RLSCEAFESERSDLVARPNRFDGRRDEPEMHSIDLLLFAIFAGAFEAYGWQTVVRAIDELDVFVEEGNVSPQGGEHRVPHAQEIAPFGADTLRGEQRLAGELLRAPWRKGEQGAALQVERGQMGPGRR